MCSVLPPRELAAHVRFMLLVQVAEEVGVGQWFVIHPREASGRGHIVIIQRSHRRGQSLVRIIGFDQDVFEWAIAVTFLEPGIDLVIFREFGGPGKLNLLTRTRLDTGNCLLAPAGQVRGEILEGPFAHRARLFHPFGADFRHQAIPLLALILDLGQ